MNLNDLISWRFNSVMRGTVLSVDESNQTVLVKWLGQRKPNRMPVSELRHPSDPYRRAVVAGGVLVWE